MKIVHSVTIRKGDLTVSAATAVNAPDALDETASVVVRAFARAWSTCETEWITDDVLDDVAETAAMPVDLDQLPPIE